jgi:hypothetical protein
MNPARVRVGRVETRNDTRGGSNFRGALEERGTHRMIFPLRSYKLTHLMGGMPVPHDPAVAA